MDNATLEFERWSRAKPATASAGQPEDLINLIYWTFSLLRGGKAGQAATDKGTFPRPAAAQQSRNHWHIKRWRFVRQYDSSEQNQTRICLPGLQGRLVLTTARIPLAPPLNEISKRPFWHYTLNLPAKRMTGQTSPGSGYWDRQLTHQHAAPCNQGIWCVSVVPPTERNAHQ